MDLKTVEEFLENGKGLNYVFRPKPDHTGLLEVWKHEGRFVLTWEEYPRGNAYNENRYTKDERHLFETFEELVSFLESHGIDLQSFQQPRL